MAFCSNCGRELQPGERFCPGCGAEVGTIGGERFVERKQTFVGEIRKCPVCGAEVPSFTGICPSCGHEFTSLDKSKDLERFTRELEKCDADIADAKISDAQHGLALKYKWQSWGIGKKVFYVILNLYTLGIVAIVQASKAKKSGVQNYTKLEPIAKEKKARCIQNYQFQNDKTTILEVLSLIESKLSFILTLKPNKENVYWANIWNSRTEQMYSKSKMLFGEDQRINQLYQNINKKYKSIKKSFYRKRIIIIGGIILFYVINILLSTSTVPK